MDGGAYFVGPGESHTPHYWREKGRSVFVHRALEPWIPTLWESQEALPAFDIYSLSSPRAVAGLGDRRP